MLCPTLRVDGPKLSKGCIDALIAAGDTTQAYVDRQKDCLAARGHDDEWGRLATPLRASNLVKGVPMSGHLGFGTGADMHRVCECPLMTQS